jgi:hypothetical protein
MYTSEITKTGIPHQVTELLYKKKKIPYLSWMHSTLCIGAQIITADLKDTFAIEEAFIVTITIDDDTSIQSNPKDLLRISARIFSVWWRRQSALELSYQSSSQ